MVANNMHGTLPSSIAAWCDITTFNVYANALTGSLPASIATNWTKIRDFQIAANQLSGTLPGLRFARMSFCLVTSDRDGNSFECPFPNDVTKHCFSQSGCPPGEFRPGQPLCLVSPCDCKHKCTGSSEMLPQTECNAWGCFYDAAGGANWNVCSDSKEDPCSCPGTELDGSYPTCNDKNTTITNMYAACLPHVLHAPSTHPHTRSLPQLPNPFFACAA